LKPNDFDAVQRQLANLQYNSYYSPGKQAAKAYGGVLIAVKNSISHNLASKHSSDDHQHLAITTKQWIIYNSYLPPRANNQAEGQQQLRELMQRTRAAAGSRPWIAMGDYNMTPTEVEPLFQQFGGELINKQPRWDSNRYIDHMWTNNTAACTRDQTMQYKLSDHRILTRRITSNWQQPTTRCILQQHYVWTIPPGYTNKTWKEQLTSTWLHTIDKTTLANHLDLTTGPFNQQRVDDSWAHFTGAIQDLYRTAAAQASPPTDPGQAIAFDHWQQQATTATNKPAEPRTLWISQRLQRDLGNMKTRKRCNCLARASRLCELLRLPCLNQQQRHEQAQLARKLHLSNATASQIPILQEQIQQQQHNLATEEAENKKHKLQQWQQSMKHDTAARNKWVRRNNCNTTNFHVTHDNEVLLHDQAVLQQVHQRWNHLWQTASLPEHAETATALVLSHLPQHQRLQNRPTLEDFTAAKATLKGAQGPDGWIHSEFSMLPDDITDWFRRATAIWETTQLTPTCLKYSRQCNIPKPGKIIDGRIDVSALRPINVYSLWYRWWSSTWSRSDMVRTWVAGAFPPTLSARIGCEQQASALADGLATHGLLATLDYKLAFDHIDPTVVTAAMIHMGLPACLAHTVCSHWQDQRRFLQFQKSTAPEPLTTAVSIPQGDPLSPLSLTIMMLAGYNFVEAAAPQQTNNRLHIVYMDDRSFVTDNADLLVATIRAWHGFSMQVGLSESSSKTQLTYYTREHRRALERTLQEHPDLANTVQTSACILGSCTSSYDRPELHERESQRLQEAVKVCSRIRFLPTAHQTKLETARSLAGSPTHPAQRICRKSTLQSGPVVRPFQVLPSTCTTCFWVAINVWKLLLVSDRFSSTESGLCRKTGQQHFIKPVYLHNGLGFF